jgi:hypothetical protein
VVTGSRELFSNTVKRLEAGIRQRASEVGVDASEFDNLLHELKDPFIGLETKFLQDKYIAKELNVLVCVI